MRLELLCPACGIRDFDFDDYESLVLLAPNLALMRFACSCCGIHLGVTLKLTPEMQRRVQRRLSADANEDTGEDTGEAGDKDALPCAETSDNLLRAGTDGSCDACPHPAIVSYASSLVLRRDDPDFEFMRPLRAGATDMKAQLEHFKRQLETVDTVDEVIGGSGFGGGEAVGGIGGKDGIDAGSCHERREP
ncbi:MAG: hypothetical protein LBH56_02215 [Coriobacteriales bacterium]|nr:hypothetical protein [Coriobacteriales bacterium]